MLKKSHFNSQNGGNYFVSLLQPVGSCYADSLREVEKTITFEMQHSIPHTKKLQMLRRPEEESAGLRVNVKNKGKDEKPMREELILSTAACRETNTP